MPRTALTGRRRVSGEVVLVSGQPVKVSGETLELASGTGPISVSGQPIRISGETVELASGTGPISVSGQPIRISGETVIAKVSGEEVKLASGETVIAEVSGETVIAKVSGETVELASGTGPISVSGQPIRISGEVVKISGEAVKISGEVVKISGQVVDLKAPTAIKTSGLFTVTGASGGANLYSGAVVSATVKALSGNSGDIFVGGSGYKPYSGYGFLLEPGEAVNLDVDNFGEIWVVATVSGDKVTYLGVA